MNGGEPPFRSLRTRPILAADGEAPEKAAKIKDPAKPTRAKAARPDDAPTPDALADLLNPGIKKGTRRHGLRHRICSRRRTIRSTAAAISPRRTPRANRRTGIRGSAADGLSRRRRSRASIRTGQELGLGDEEAEAPRLRQQSGPRKYRLPRPICRRSRAASAASQPAVARPAAARGPAGIRPAGPWTPHRPPRPEKSEGGSQLRHQVRLRAEGRPAAGDQGPGRGRAAATTARRCCSASPAPARPSPWRR